MTNIDANEQARRRELIRDTRAASQQGLELPEYREKREKAISEWTAWFHSEMDKCHASDPVEVLPAALALLQERATAAARTAARAAAHAEVKAILRKAITHG
jgi:hypothetical protein